MTFKVFAYIRQKQESFFPIKMNSQKNKLSCGDIRISDWLAGLYKLLQVVTIADGLRHRYIVKENLLQLNFSLVHSRITLRFMAMILIYGAALELGIIWLQIRCLSNLRKIFISFHLW